MIPLKVVLNFKIMWDYSSRHVTLDLIQLKIFHSGLKMGKTSLGYVEDHGGPKNGDVKKNLV